MTLESTAAERLCGGLFELSDSDAILKETARIVGEACGFHMSCIADTVDGGAVIRYATRNRTRRQMGVFLRSGLGLGGKVHASGRILAVDDYVSSGSITHDYDYTVTGEDLGAVIAAPIAFGRHTYGVLFGAYRGEHALGDRSMRLLEGVAARCGEALFFAERVRAAAARAVYEERRRTATSLQHQVDSALSQILKDLRKAGNVAGLDDDVVRRLQQTERRAIASAQCLQRSLESLCGDGTPQNPAPKARASAKRPIAHREYEVLRRVAIGETNEEIAAALGLSYNTIKTYLRNAMAKLGARNRVEAILFAKERGLL